MENVDNTSTVSKSELIEGLDLRRRLGIFAIARHTVDSNPLDVMRALANCVVVRCELRYDADAFHYIAISPLFDVVPKGQLPNDYQIQFNNYSKSVHFVKI